jgi:hypothetical protein
MLAGIQAAQAWRSDEEMPNDLFPMSNNVGTVRPMSSPATNQCHGWVMNSNISENDVKKTATDVDDNQFS